MAPHAQRDLFGLWLGAIIARPLMLLVVRDEALGT
jgi:hypothetical protein